MIFISKSSLLSRIFFSNHFTDIWTPWVVLIDFEKDSLEVLKKNWYLIGVDKQIIPFKNIRKLTIDEHLFGADIQIKVYGGTINAKCLKKHSASEIRDAVLHRINLLKSTNFS